MVQTPNQTKIRGADATEKPTWLLCATSDVQSAPATTSQPPPTSGLTVEFYTKLHAAIVQPDFLSTEEDLSSIELFCGLLADLLQTPSSFKDKQEAAKYVTLLSYHLNCSSYRWACLRTYFSLERVKRVVTTSLLFVVALMNQTDENVEDEPFLFETTAPATARDAAPPPRARYRDDARSTPPTVQGRRPAPDIRSRRGARRHFEAEGREAPNPEHKRPRHAGAQSAPCDGPQQTTASRRSSTSSAPTRMRRTTSSTTRSSASQRCSRTSASRSTGLWRDSTRIRRTYRRTSRACCTSSRRCSSF